MNKIEYNRIDERMINTIEWNGEKRLDRRDTDRQYTSTSTFKSTYLYLYIYMYTYA